MSGWVEDEFGHGRLVDLNEQVVELKYSDDTLHLVKGIDPDTQELVGLAFDGTGKAYVDNGIELLRKEFDARQAIMGTMEPELYEHTVGLEQSERVPVVIWLRTYDEPVDREVILADPVARAANEKVIAARLASARDKLASWWSKSFTTEIVFEPNAPAAYAELTVGELEQLSRMDAVAAVFLQKPYELHYGKHSAKMRGENTCMPS